MNEDDLRRILANPFYAIEIHPMLAEAHDPLVSEDDWIAAAKKTIEEDGLDRFLQDLLAALKDPVT